MHVIHPDTPVTTMWLDTLLTLPRSDASLGMWRQLCNCVDELRAVLAGHTLPDDLALVRQYTILVCLAWGKDIEWLSRGSKDRAATYEVVMEWATQLAEYALEMDLIGGAS